MNVYIIAKEKVPILIRKDLFAMPQLSFAEADSLKLQADAIVIPVHYPFATNTRTLK